MTCRKCGYQQEQRFDVCPVCNEVSVKVEEKYKSKLLAGLLGIFLGAYGGHNFYLGFTSKAVIQLLLGIFCLGIGSGVWGLIEGILILTGSISEDAAGNPLKE